LHCLCIVVEAGLLQDAVGGIAVRQCVSDDRPDARVGERLGEHRARRRGGESTPPPGFGDLVSKLDDAVRRRSLEATPADELLRVAGDEETRAPQNDPLVFAATASRVVWSAAVNVAQPATTSWPSTAASASSLTRAASSRCKSARTRRITDTSFPRDMIAGRLDRRTALSLRAKSSRLQCRRCAAESRLERHPTDGVAIGILPLGCVEYASLRVHDSTHPPTQRYFPHDPARASAMGPAAASGRKQQSSDERRRPAPRAPAP